MAEPIHPTIQAARDFIKSLKDMPIPDGSVKDKMSDTFRDKKGAMAGLRAIAAFIELHQEGAAIDANKKLLARLKGEDGYDIVGIIGDLTFASPDEVPVKLNMLRQAMTIRGDQNVFEAMNLAAANINVDEKLHLDDVEEGGIKGSKGGGRRNHDPKEDEDTWRKFLHGGPKFNFSDDDIKQSAEDYDKRGGTPDNDAIRDSSQGGRGIFQPNKEHMSEYERREGEDNRGEYIKSRLDGEWEMRAYVKMANLLRVAYNQTLGKSIEPVVSATRTGG